jgi:putative inorganic carbon (HCO3(-)) transporter
VIDRVSGWLSAGELAILFLASPLFLFIRPSFAPVLLLLPVFWLARRHSRGYFLPRTPVDWSIVGLLSMTLISLFVTPDPSSSLGKVVGLVYSVAVFYAMVEWGRRRPGVLIQASIVAAAGAGTAVLSLVGTQWNVKWSMLESMRAYLPQMIRNLPGAETGFNPNTVSGTLITFVPVQAALLIGFASAGKNPRPSARWLAAGTTVSLVLTVGVVLLAQSRAAWIALALGLLGMAGILVRRFRVIFFLGIAAGILVMVLVGPVGVSDWLVEQGWMLGSADISWNARVERWSRALWAIADHPLTGMGMDIFRWQAQQQYLFLYVPLSEDLGHAHNTFLQVALDLGLTGLICYLAMLGGSLVLGWTWYRGAASRMASLAALGGIVGLATHATWSTLDALPLGARTNVLWWVVLALVITVVIREDRQKGPERDGFAD